MKILVVFYSRTGNTKKVGNEISKILNAKTDEIIDKKDRSGIVGWFIGGKDAIFSKTTEIEFKENPSSYDLAIIGTPVWAYTMTPAVRSYISKNSFNNIAFFCTFSSNPGNTFKDMESIAKKPLAVLGLKDKDIDNPSSMNQIKVFCNDIIAKSKGQ